MKKLMGMAVAVLALSGCWSAGDGGRFMMRGYEEQGVATIAVLPAVNQTDWLNAPEAMQAALAATLTREKKYAVIPPARVAATLNRGGGASTWAAMIDAMNLGREPGDQPLGRLARDLEADALLSASVVAFHQTFEERPAASPQGQIYYRQSPVTVIQVKAFLWGTRAGTVVWRDEHTERYYHEPGTEGRGQASRIAEIAARELLARLPERK